MYKLFTLIFAVLTGAAVIILIFAAGAQYVAIQLGDTQAINELTRLGWLAFVGAAGGGIGLALARDAQK